MKTKKIMSAVFIVILAACIVFCPFAMSAVYAADGSQEIAAEEEINTESTAGIEGVADNFLNYLKERYGDDYLYYYDKIIDNWGSVEAYLLSFGDKLPEEHKNAWQKFVGWLSEYSSVWAPAFAVAVVIIVALIGKKQFNKIVDRIVNVKLQPIVGELNKQSSATVSILHAQKALLGTGERFAESVKELEKSEKELKNG